MHTADSSDTFVSSYLILRCRLQENLQSNLKCVGKILINLSCYLTTNNIEVSRHPDQQTHRCVSHPYARPMEDLFLSLASKNLPPPLKFKTT